MGEDLADSLDDLICAWDKVMAADLETLVLLLLGWLGFGGFIFLLAHIIFSSLGTGGGEQVDGTSQKKEATKPVEAAPNRPLEVVKKEPVKSEANGDRKIIQPVAKEVSRLPKEEVKLRNKQPPLQQSQAVNGRDAEEEKAVGNPPVAIGSDPHIVEYINKCWRYLYSTKKARDIAKRGWLRRMNDFTEKSARDDGLLVEFLDIVDESTMKLDFSNMTAEQQSSKNMFVSSDLESAFKMKIKTIRPIKGKYESSEFLLNVNKLRARLSVAVIMEERSLICKLEGWPNLTLQIQPAAGHTGDLSREDQNLYELIEDITSSAIRGVQINFKLDEFPNFPVYVPKGLPVAAPQENAQFQMLSNKFGQERFSSPKRLSNGVDGPTRKLDVKVVKATQLGGQSSSCIEPYVVIEVDEPSQRFQTKCGSGPQTVWDQTFTMSISKSSSEILIEVWDQGQKIGDSDLFLGLGIVSVNELLVTVSQRHVIPLQGRPLEGDQVTGMLTLEFLFKDGGITFPEAENLPGIHRSTELRQSKGVNGTAQVNTITTYSLTEPADVVPVNDEIAEVAVKGLLLNGKPIDQQPNKSTLLIHSVQKRVATPSSSAQSAVPDSGNNVTDSVTDATSQTSLDSDLMRRGREKKRNLVSSIKKRFSGTTRSLSSGIKLGFESRSSSTSRGDSWDRGHVRSASEHRPCSIGSNSHLRLPGLQSEDASSLSDVSGISAASHKTYITEESSLVIETLENGMNHHYLIPPQVAKGGRFKKRGTKLHIFLDHIFVARHIKLGTVCHSCGVPIPMRLGKQAYVCRDCGIITHKPCHVKVETHCQRTSLPTMELEYLG